MRQQVRVVATTVIAVELRHPACAAVLYMIVLQQCVHASQCILVVYLLAGNCWFVGHSFILRHQRP